MVASRFGTAAVGLAASLVGSVVLWQVFDIALFLLAVPFVPFLFRDGGSTARRPPARTCPECGFSTRNAEFEHCPRDGTNLETP